MNSIKPLEIQSVFALVPKPDSELTFQPLMATDVQDLNFYQRLYRCPATCRFIGGVQSIEESTKTFNYICRNHRPGKLLQFKILLSRAERPIGVCALIWSKKRSAVEAGIHIDADYQQQGFGARTLRQLLCFAFEQLTIAEVYWRFDPDNVGSRRLVQRLPYATQQLSKNRWLIFPSQNEQVSLSSNNHIHNNIHNNCNLKSKDY